MTKVVMIEAARMNRHGGWSRSALNGSDGHAKSVATATPHQHGSLRRRDLRKSATCTTRRYGSPLRTPLTGSSWSQLEPQHDPPPICPESLRVMRPDGCAHRLRRQQGTAGWDGMFRPFREPRRQLCVSLDLQHTRRARPRHKPRPAYTRTSAPQESPAFWQLRQSPSAPSSRTPGPSLRGKRHSSPTSVRLAGDAVAIPVQMFCIPGLPTIKRGRAGCACFAAIAERAGAAGGAQECSVGRVRTMAVIFAGFTIGMTALGIEPAGVRLQRRQWHAHNTTEQQRDNDGRPQRRTPPCFTSGLASRSNS